ncbi:MAG: hypothetical protein WA978_00005 [Sphingopyxis granuli]|jgi:hypothetical protein|uniref:hypothetical protein n=1 Tax=Sphingopyxis granuli TaxID=267128 RepID=UPI003C7247AD
MAQIAVALIDKLAAQWDARSGRILHRRAQRDGTTQPSAGRYRTGLLASAAHWPLSRLAQARWIINGTDEMPLIADHTIDFQDAGSAGGRA